MSRDGKGPSARFRATIRTPAQYPSTIRNGTALWLCLSALLHGCTTVEIRGSTGSVTKHYFGRVYLRVDLEDGETRVLGHDVRGVGLRVGNGVGVGYFRDRKISVPLDCRLVVLVDDDRKLAGAIRLLSEATKGERLCGTDF